MADYPRSIVAQNTVAPVPRRVRATAGAQVVLDTTRALYVWENVHYPQYYIPRDDVAMNLLAAEGDPHPTPQGDARNYTIVVDARARSRAARLIVASPLRELRDTLRFTWGALDKWFEEDEEVFVHPRDPYTRVDALRSTRRVRVELEGAVLAESGSPVLVFETGLPTRYYVDQACVRFDLLTRSQTRTACPYKGTVSGYWSALRNGKMHPDLAWTYSFPTRELQPIAGLVAFLNERVDMFVDGIAQPRPATHMS